MDNKSWSDEITLAQYHCRLSYIFRRALFLKLELQRRDCSRLWGRPSTQPKPNFSLIHMQLRTTQLSTTGHSNCLVDFPLPGTTVSPLAFPLSSSSWPLACPSLLAPLQKSSETLESESHDCAPTWNAPKRRIPGPSTGERGRGRPVKASLTHSSTRVGRHRPSCSAYGSTK